MRKIATTLLTLISHLSGRFITIHTRPIRYNGGRHTTKETEADATCAIVIQGPIKKEGDFTYETVRLYQKHYPAATIILSTWEQEDTSQFTALSGKRFLILKNKEPQIPAPGNMNYQIISSKAGVDKAATLGLLYTLKTRTDQRIYSTNLLTFLKESIEYFPLINGGTQTRRIVGTSSSTSHIRPYQFSDLFMFGRTSDMVTFWDADLLLDTKINARTFHAEGYLFKQFLNRVGWDIKNTPDDFIRALGERCIIFDNELLDIYWPKYVSLLREHRIKTYLLPELQITFKAWLNTAYIPTLSINQHSPH